MNFVFRASLLALGSFCVVSCAAAQNIETQVRNSTFEELVASRGWNFEAAQVEAEQITTNLYLLKGIGGNVLASIGEDGTLLIDDQFPEMAPKLIAAIQNAGGEDINVVVNTHWHHDHADGNKTFGPAGATIISQANSRTMMTGDHWVNLVREAYLFKAYPKDALPIATFEKAMQLHFNGDSIDLMHFGPAHTTGDTAVYFRNANVVHMGDVFNTAGYPFIDVDNGGSLDGVIAFCLEILDRTNKSTVYIPGHGSVANRTRLKKYVEMLKAVEKRLSSMIAKGENFSDIVQSNITREWDADYGDPLVFLNRAYESELKTVSSRE